MACRPPCGRVLRCVQARTILPRAYQHTSSQRIVRQRAPRRGMSLQAGVHDTQPGPSARIAPLRHAMLRRDADATFDALLALESSTMLSATEYHAIVRVLLDAHPRTRMTARRTLAVIEHAKRARMRAAAAGDTLVYSELDNLVRGAFLWNSVLASIASRQRHMPQDALDELFDVFAAGEGAAGVRAHADIFPNTVSYNTLLHAIACRVPLRRFRNARVHRAEQLFDAAWARLCSDPHVSPDAVSWTTRVAFYTRTGARERIAECTMAMHQHGVLTNAGVNAALWAYVRLWNVEARGDLDGLREVYAHIKAQRALETSVPTLPVLPPVPLSVATCALLIRVLSARGDLAGALDVMHDLVGLHGDTPLSVYHALFRGFARFGKSARIVERHSDPTRCVWSAPGGTLWTVHTLVPLFDGYIRACGTHRRQAAAALRRVSGNDIAWTSAQLARLTCYGHPPDAGVGSTR